MNCVNIYFSGVTESVSETESTSFARKRLKSSRNLLRKNLFLCAVDGDGIRSEEIFWKLFFAKKGDGEDVKSNAAVETEERGDLVCWDATKISMNDLLVDYFYIVPKSVFAPCRMS